MYWMVRILPLFGQRPEDGAMCASTGQGHGLPCAGAHVLQGPLVLALVSGQLFLLIGACSKLTICVLHL